MSLVIEQSDYFWADLQRQVDWYRDKAGSDVATRYVDSVQATLQQLAKVPGIGALDPGTGQSSRAFVPGACKSPTIAT